MPFGRNENEEGLILDIENLEKLPTLPDKPQKLKNEGEVVLEMLLPTALKVPEYSFIDVEDLDVEDFSRKSRAKAPLTAAQQERLNHENRVKKM
jgi:hypothetical protein